MADTVTVAFYKNSVWYDWLIRWDTRRKGQPFSDVPSHCALILPIPECKRGWLYEMVSTGFHERVAMLDDYENPVKVSVPDLKALKALLASQQNCRYGWLTILEIMLCRLCPQKWFASTRGQKQQDCSWLVKSALEVGGWDCPRWLRQQYQPPSPNDLLFAVRETLGETL